MQQLKAFVLIFNKIKFISKIFNFTRKKKFKTVLKAYKRIESDECRRSYVCNIRSLVNIHKFTKAIEVLIFSIYFIITNEFIFINIWYTTFVYSFLKPFKVLKCWVHIRNSLLESTYSLYA